LQHHISSARITRTRITRTGVIVIRECQTKRKVIFFFHSCCVHLQCKQSSEIYTCIHKNTHIAALTLIH
jgi:hypothetical protein